MASCIVSFLDTEGLRRTVEVEAESLYEAGVLAIRTFRQHDCERGQVSNLEVEVRSSVIHTITPESKATASYFFSTPARLASKALCQNSATRLMTPSAAEAG